MTSLQNNIPNLSDHFFHFEIDSKDTEISDKITILESKEIQCTGKKFVFRIIGESHYITTEDLYGEHFIEIFSCLKIPGSEKIPLTLKVKKSLRAEKHDLKVHSKIKTVELQHVEVQKEEYYDMYKVFPITYGVTAIKVHVDGYETLHTYPEKGLAYITYTNFLKTVTI